MLSSAKMITYDIYDSQSYIHDTYNTIYSYTRSPAVLVRMRVTEWSWYRSFCYIYTSYDIKSRSLHWTVAHTLLDLVAHSTRCNFFGHNLLHHLCPLRSPCGGGPHTQSRSSSKNHILAPSVLLLCRRRLAKSLTAVIYHTSGSPRAFWSGILRHTRILVFFLHSR